MVSFSKMLTVRKQINIADRYRIIKKIGCGSFGEVFLGINLVTGEEVALKVESILARYPQLLYESKVYTLLQGGIGIPYIQWYGYEKEHNILVMDLLGPSLEDLFNYCSRQFTMKTVLMLADQILARVEFVHCKCFLHRDIKPENLVMGRGRQFHKLYMIDFGLAKKYCDFYSGAHISYCNNRNLTGTVRYASVNSHLGIEQSRRDDMESIGYILIYFCKGSLPWQGVKGHTKFQKHDRIREMKTSIPIEILCNGFPAEFAMYLKYCRSLSFDEAPNYWYLRQLFSTLFDRMRLQYDYNYDWKFMRRNKEQLMQAGPSQQQPKIEVNAAIAMHGAERLFNA